MARPFYELDEETKGIITDLITTCTKNELGNVEFRYFPTEKCPYGVLFRLIQYKGFWELVVGQERPDRLRIYFAYRDIYRITGEKVLVIEYRKSEQEMM